MVVLLLALCFLPLCAWCVYAFARKILALPSILYSLLAGLVAVILASVLQLALDPAIASFSGLPGVLLRSLVVSALVEESVRLGAIRLQPVWSKDTYDADALRAFLAGAVAIGFSFAAFENVAYAVRNPASLALRYLTAVPLHASLALVCAMSFAGRFSGSRTFLPGYYIGAVILHGIYNVCMETGGALVIPACLLVVLVVWFACRLWGRSGDDDHADRPEY
jgi:RsiW-degrading membrane proteinase PrsW (M82 family)